MDEATPTGATVTNILKIVPSHEMTRDTFLFDLVTLIPLVLGCHLLRMDSANKSKLEDAVKEVMDGILPKKI
ncbi:hypothetical protein NQ315_015951 [Exocentrus adspersus]|uniref:Uncharacterized protein n=1 Tax=Exocentrus adspersus TaxID=1586481 RepID=A0AAV8VIW5_9CUCU|nr:hypothetical protein NQ315_015951 [Exocentrus adspersus]